MKKTLQLLGFTLIVFFAQHTQAQDTIVNIPDANFKAKLLEANTSNGIASDSSRIAIKIDINNDGNIQQSEANRVYKLHIQESNISSLVGLSSFVNLKDLNCAKNQLTSLNIFYNTKLEFLYIENNQLVNVDFSNNTNLIELQCRNNMLSSLETSNNHKLRILFCQNNKISVINVSNNLFLELLYCSGNQLINLVLGRNTNLKYLYCNGNQLHSLDVNLNTNLESLYCDQNLISILDINNNPNLEILSCSFNKLTNFKASNLPNLTTLICSNTDVSSLELSKSSNLKFLNCGSNPLLRNIYIKNKVNFFGFQNNVFFIRDCPNLKYICADAEEIDALDSLANEYGYSNVIINSFCSTSSGGAFYTMKTNSHYDANNNGCTAQDSLFPNLKYLIKNATDSGYAIADAQGNMSLDLNAGTYTIKPIFSNPYFTISPAQANVSLPEDTLPTQFCITSKGIFNDVSIQIIPTNDARPGFSDATYRIVYTNKGTTTVSGNINFTFQDSIQDFVSSSVVPTNNANGVLTYYYSNLKPFESRSIIVKLHTNAPTDNPAVNGGDVLQLQAIATMNTTSNANTSDDTSIIRQTVVNSYDPNDKRCLEGNIVTPDFVGDFVNYLIRFENEGTANAINIVVTDRIDTTKFEIASLEITASSHSNRTLITEGNKVQFIFDNINLPFTEPLKHGFIAFKIKTKNNLVIGDSLKNYANIYFDYNLPITTNIAGSKIDTFARTGGVTSIKSNTNKEGKLSVYPNPSNGNFKVNFESKGEFPIHIKLIDLNGRLIKSIEDVHQNQTTIDISESQLSNGLYQISIQTDKDIWLKKIFINK